MNATNYISRGVRIIGMIYGNCECHWELTDCFVVLLYQSFFYLFFIKIYKEKALIRTFEPNL